MAEGNSSPDIAPKPTEAVVPSPEKPSTPQSPNIPRRTFIAGLTAAAASLFGGRKVDAAVPTSARAEKIYDKGGEMAQSQLDVQDKGAQMTARQEDVLDKGAEIAHSQENVLDRGQQMAQNQETVAVKDFAADATNIYDKGSEMANRQTEVQTSTINQGDGQADTSPASPATPSIDSEITNP